MEQEKEVAIEDINSLYIQELARVHNPTGAPAILLGDNGHTGDRHMALYRMPWGVEVITNNGMPVWEGEEGFADDRAAVLAGRCLVYGEELEMPYA